MSITEPIDGLNLWDALSLDILSPRTEVLCIADPINEYLAYINGNYKYINGTLSNGVYDGWLSNVFDRSERYPAFESYGQMIVNSEVGQALGTYSTSLVYGDGYRLQANEIEYLREKSVVKCEHLPNDNEYSCNPLEAPCLFNIVQDPCELRNLAKEEPDTFIFMQEMARYFQEISVPPKNKAVDECANPKYYNNTWTYWHDVVGIEDCWKGNL